ncbi:MAG: SPOR domain-containing protein [Dysgonamonadaceae bacterium]|jgi:cell division protein FtsN|nr:SPOR domain-containing protein [Dysgonamonadaceae bacterium]
MKSKIYLFVLAFTLLFSLNACKSKQSAYRRAYEAAKAKELQESKPQQNNFVEVVEPAPVYRPKIQEPEESFQIERVTSVEGSATVRRYNVVIGSFINATNARSLKNRMERQGYKPVMAQNEKGMYRIIIASYDDRASAIMEKNEIKDRFAPEFSDAWLLQQE